MLRPMPPERKTKPLSADHAALGQAVQTIMADKRLTLDDVSTGGLSIKQVGEITRGQSNPTYLNMLKLAAGLNTTLGQLMTRVDEARKWL